MARLKNTTKPTSEDLVSHHERIRRQVMELASRLSGGDSGVFRTLKVQKRAMKQVEQQLRFVQKRERKLAWEM